jgi:putative DNA primase/helicase
VAEAEAIVSDDTDRWNEYRDWCAEDDRAGEAHSGQVRMAYRLATAYKHKLLHVHGLGWRYWDGTRWAEDDIGAAKRAVIDVLRNALAESLNDKPLRKDVQRCESDNGINGVLGIAAALTEFAATVRDLDADPYLLNLANGTLDLRTLQLRNHDPIDRITKLCRGAHHTDTAAPVWDAFLAKVLPDEDVRKFVQRLVGLALLGEVREHILPIYTGTGANGKGTFYKAVLHALGDYASTADPNLFMHRDGAHPTGEMDLLGKRLIVVSESDENRRLAEATMKRLTGGDPIKARYMRRDFVQFMPSHVPILVTNHLPQVSGDDPAIWRRLRVVPFSVVIPEDEQDKTLDAQLQLEADGILSWAIAGLRDYLERGLDEPGSVRAATAAYHADSDDIGRFISDQCIVANTVKVSAGELFDAWERWRKLNSAAEISKTAFGKALARRGFTSSDSNGKRWWHGICILQQEEQ